ncbi:MAG: HAMP domain-containing sensor histidine kinase [Patescibacteria group bacterium]
MNILSKTARALNVKRQCAEYGVGLWQCPQFLFIIMGIIIIAAIVVTNVAARIYAEPEIAALIAMVVSAFLFIVGHIIVRAFEKVAAASRSKSEFISVVSHEMRNPLSAIRWQLDVMRGQTEKIDPTKLLTAIAVLETENLKALRLVNDLLEAYRIEDNNLGLQPRPFSIIEITKQAISNLENQAKKANVKISLLANENTPHAFADPKKIQIVIEHLINNAISYSDGGAAVISIERKKDHVLWTISDQGVGIPADELKKVFGKFFRSNNRMRFNTGGLGLGLYISREIIRASGGTMDIRSIEGRGTTMWLTLPINPLAK